MPIETKHLQTSQILYHPYDSQAGPAVRVESCLPLWTLRNDVVPRQRIQPQAINMCEKYLIPSTTLWRQGG